MKDMSKREFFKVLDKYGMRYTGIMGWVEIGSGVTASIFNSPDGSYRGILSYLIKRQKETTNNCR